MGFRRVLAEVQAAFEDGKALYLDPEDVRKVAAMLELGEASRIAEAYDLSGYDNHADEREPVAEATATSWER